MTPQPPLNAPDGVWEEWFRVCAPAKVLDAWTWAIDHDDRRIADMARNSAAGRFFQMVAAARCKEERRIQQEAARRPCIEG